MAIAYWVFNRQCGTKPANCATRTLTGDIRAGLMLIVDRNLFCENNTEEASAAPAASIKRPSDGQTQPL